MKRKELNEFQIANLVQKGNVFNVFTERERKKALAAGKYLGVRVTTRAASCGCFVVYTSTDAVSN